ncbi:hypothetical protein [Brucella pituitosa]|uniref:hypothetical protein n=1 Tax=Brucella pituitosa TaxID=571256 RepID=UPI000C277470|nr:hypothetical protein [Brucella pituitosa]PJO48909.1 hypothetical protein CWE02_03695 [Brucella pituitosa]
MTAEIAIINRSAVALAADSKVTLSMGGRQKTYDTVNKLFALSKTEPIGAMIYGNAEFIGFPWETVIKEYRRRRPTLICDTVFLVAEDFLAFLLSFFKFSVDDEDRTAIGIAQAWAQHIFDQSYAGEDLALSIRQSIDTYLAELDHAENFLSNDEWAGIENRISNRLRGICSFGVMQNFPQLQNDLYRLVSLGIRKSMSSPATSGVVIAGFGDKELLPSLVAYNIDGILAGRLKSIEIRKYDTTRNSQGVILPFAQSDMVYRFMEGIDPEYATLLHESLEQLLLGNARDIAGVVGLQGENLDAIMPAIEAAVKSSSDAYWAAHERHRRERFASPIIDMAASLPKDELANLAESLVSLTSLQRRVSRDIETVGGAVDVAVISKGDGFVWVKRKHYFPADRNLRFINSYFLDYNGQRQAGGPHADDA